MIGTVVIDSVSPLIVFDRFQNLDLFHHVRQVMASKVTNSNSREAKPRVTFQQKKIRRQQIFMSFVAIILVMSMVLALVMK